jgi:tRNA threonylcarbamoyladenosine biosynthesis protein TsaE
MLAFAPAGPADAPAVHAVTRQAYDTGPPLDPPPGALLETVDDVAADLTAHGGVLGTDDGRPVASLRFRFVGETSWLRRVGVVPDLWRHSVGTRLVAHAHAVAAQRPGLAELRVGVRFARPGSRRFWESLSYAVDTSHEYWDELSRPPPYAGTAERAEDMRTLGRRLAMLLRAGDLIVCIGGLGAGKTTFAQGVGAGLGVRGAVTSPTFVLARAHRSDAGGVSFVHADAYRLGAVSDPLGELDALDLDAGLDESVTLVEWGEGLVERLAVNRLEVRIDVAEGDDEVRRVVVDALGVRWSGVDLRAVLRGATAP